MSDVDPEPAGRIRGWSRAVTAWPWATLLLALAFVAFAAIAGRGAADHLSSGGWVTPGAESTRAEATLDEHFPAARPNLLLMVRPRGGSAASVDDPRIAAQARELSQHLASEKSVSGVISYWDTHLAGLRAKNGSEALITAQVRGSESQADKVLERIAPAYRGVHGDLDVSLGGAVAVRSEIQKTIKDDLLRFLIEQKAAGKRVAAYGAAAKGNTLLNYAGVKPDLLPFVCDAATAKQGKFMPGSHIPILPPAVLETRRPDVLLVLPWNIADEIRAAHRGLAALGTQFVTAVPRLAITR